MKAHTYGKYSRRGRNYHWRQISKSLRERNLHTVARYEIISNLLQSEPQHIRILDIGCGDGVLAFTMGQKHARIIGMDQSREAIEYAFSKCKHLDTVHFQIGSAYKLPFRDEAFDCVVCSELIEHLRYPEKMLLEVSRVWTGKGKVIITTPIKLIDHITDSTHYQEFSEEGFRQTLAKSFLRCKIEIIRSHPCFWMEVYQKPVLGRRIFRFLLNLLSLISGINPFMSRSGQMHYTVQTAIISK